MRVVAILAVHNERPHLSNCLSHLIEKPYWLSSIRTIYSYFARGGVSGGTAVSRLLMTLRAA
jgi:hypothetical protein